MGPAQTTGDAGQPDVGRSDLDVADIRLVRQFPVEEVSHRGWGEFAAPNMKILREIGRFHILSSDPTGMLCPRDDSCRIGGEVYRVLLADVIFGDGLGLGVAVGRGPEGSVPARARWHLEAGLEITKFKPAFGNHTAAGEGFVFGMFGLEREDKVVVGNGNVLRLLRAPHFAVRAVIPIIQVQGSAIEFIRPRQRVVLHDIPVRSDGAGGVLCVGRRSENQGG